MKSEQLENNPYFSFSKNSFLQAIEKKREMESDFKPSMIDEYRNVSMSIAKNAIEMLKLGIEFIEEGNSINFLLGDEFYSVPYTDLVAAGGKEQTDMLLKKEKKVEEKKEPEESQKAFEDPQKYQSGIEDVVPHVYDNPFLQALSMVINPTMFNQVQNPPQAVPQEKVPPTLPQKKTASSILSDISDIQRHVILLEQEKDHTDNELSDTKAKLLETEEKLESYRKTASELSKATQDELEREQEENQSLRERLNEYESVINGLKEKTARLENNLIDSSNKIMSKDKELAEVRDKNFELQKQLTEKERDFSQAHDKDVKHITSLEVNLENITREKSKLETSEKQLSSNEVRHKQEISDLKNQIDKLTREQGERQQAHEKAIEEMRQRIKNANSKAEEAEARAQEAVKKLAEKETKLQDTEKKLKESDAKLQDTYSSLRDSEKRSRENEAKCKSLTESNTDLSNKLKTLENRVGDKEQKIKDLEEKLKEKPQKSQADETALKNMTIERDKLQAEVNKLNQTIGDMGKALEAAKDNEGVDIEELRHLAFHDSKFPSLLNSNAFNNDIRNINKDEVILSRAGIRGMKQINEEHGQYAGDNVIELTAAALQKAFPESSIYRVLGDQFNIISKNTTLNIVEGQLADVSRDLWEQKIEIVYGSSVGVNCKNIKEMIAIAGEHMNRQKETPVTKEAAKIYNNVREGGGDGDNRIIPKSKKPPRTPGLEEVALE